MRCARVLCIILSFCLSSVVVSEGYAEVNAEVKRVALLELRGALKDEERRYVSDLLRSTLAEALGERYQLLSRENFYALVPPKACEALERGEGGCEVEVGRMVNAHLVVSGALMKLGPLLSLRLKVHESQSGRLLGLRELAAPTLLTLRKRAPRLSWRLAELIDPSLELDLEEHEEAHTPSAPPTSSVKSSVKSSLDPSLDPSLDTETHPLTPRTQAPSQHNNLLISWVKVPKGDVTLGDLLGEPDERPLKRVTLPTFWVSATEVTEAQYGLCVKANACAPLQPCESQGASSPPPQTSSRLPVKCVSWYEAQRFAQWAGAELPSEAEWARVAALSYGTANALSRERLEHVAWFGAHQLNTPQHVALKPASELGVYDLLGNVWEWTRDRYAPYDAPPERASPPPSLDALASWPRVARGGGWRSERLESLRLSNRLSLSPHTRRRDVGFRLTRSPSPTSPHSPHPPKEP
jgi:formylglycine-generating enzyme required for sulfatase activity